MPDPFTSTTAASIVLNESGIGLDVARLRNLPSANQLPVYRSSFAADRSEAVEEYQVPWGNKDLFIEKMLGYTSNTLLGSKPANVIFDGSSITATTGAASATITLSGYTVRSVDVDRLLLIYSGTNFLPGTYTVSSVNVGAGTWTMDRVCTSGAGSALVAKSNGKGQMLRTVPVQHSDFPWLYAVEAETAGGVGVPGTGARERQLYYYGASASADGYAHIVVTYRALDYNVLTDAEAASQTVLKEMSRYVSRYDTYSAEAIEIPHHAFKYTADNVQIPTGIAKILTKKELTYVWHEVPDVPEINIEACHGLVNSALFDNYYPAETLLFIAPDKKRYRATTGRIVWELTYKFSYRPQGWNKVYRRAGAGGPGFYAVISNDSNSLKPYQSVDFVKLFEVPPPA